MSIIDACSTRREMCIPCSQSVPIGSWTVIKDVEVQTMTWGRKKGEVANFLLPNLPEEQ